MTSTWKAPVLSPRKVIVDTDAGVDDAHALLILDGASPDNIELLGLTCVAGNVKLPQALKNMSHILEHCSFQQTEIFAGAERPIISEIPPGYEVYHGADGLGNTWSEKTTSQEKLNSTKHAVQFLIDAVKANPGQISVCALGPLTNLAMAERLWPAFSSNLGNVTIMGGNIYGRGNITPAAEYNFYADPEAAQIVMQDFKCEKVLVSWELSENYHIPMKTLEEMFAIKSAKARFLWTITQHARKTEMTYLSACDQLAAICLLHPEVIKKKCKYQCKVSLCGETRGALIIDRGDHWKDFPSDAETTIIEEMDDSKFHEIYVRSLRESRGKSVEET